MPCPCIPGKRHSECSRVCNTVHCCYPCRKPTDLEECASGLYMTEMAELPSCSPSTVSLLFPHSCLSQCLRKQHHHADCRLCDRMYGLRRHHMRQLGIHRIFSIINTNLLIASFGSTIDGSLLDATDTYMSISFMMLFLAMAGIILTLILKRAGSKTAEADNGHPNRVPTLSYEFLAQLNPNIQKQTGIMHENPQSKGVQSPMITLP